jgi:hypothetical protein
MTYIPNKEGTKKESTMAKPIKETPILRGKEADHFFAKVQKNEAKKVSEKEYKRAVSIFEKVKEKNKGNF